MELSCPVCCLGEGDILCLFSILADAPWDLVTRDMESLEDREQSLPRVWAVPAEVRWKLMHWDRPGRPWLVCLGLWLWAWTRALES